MDPFVALISIIGALLIGIVSPGPSFLVVARTSIAVSRRDGLAVSLGMGLGGVFFGGLALLGLQAVLAQVPTLYGALKIAGGLYLMYLALLLWRHAPEPLRVSAAASPRRGGFGRSLALGLGTQVSNPKTALVYGSVFAAFLPAAPPLWLWLVLPPAILVAESGWYAVVALAFSAERPRAAYLRWKTVLDRVAAVVLGGLGLRLVADGARGM